MLYILFILIIFLLAPKLFWVFSYSGPEVDRLAKIASQFKVHLVMGVVERVGFYLCSTVLFFDSFGRYLGKHPKLLPLASESPVWHFGEKLLPDVYETTVGRIGGLVCWDNKMPDLRTQLYAKGKLTDLFLNNIQPQSHSSTEKGSVISASTMVLSFLNNFTILLINLSP